MSELANDINRGRKAQEWLNLTEELKFFDTIETELIAGWKTTSARDTEAREKLWQGVQITGRVKNLAVQLVNNGMLAAKELDEFAKGEKRKLFNIV